MKRKADSGCGNYETFMNNSKRRIIGTSMNISSKSRVALNNLSNLNEDPKDEVKFASFEKNNFPGLNHYFQDNYFLNSSSRDLNKIKFENNYENTILNISNTPFEDIYDNSSTNYKQNLKESSKKYVDKNLNSIFALKKKLIHPNIGEKKELQNRTKFEDICYNQEEDLSIHNNNTKKLENNDKLSCLPQELRVIFSIDKFNSIQNKCFEQLFNSNNNIIISSPTGSGKTILFEIAICKVIYENLFLKKDNPNKNFKIIYLAPIKSLCQEKLLDWKQRFSKLNIGVTESTGDTDYINFPTIFTSNIILTTPEKFDSITRKWKEYSSFISNISLLLIDEVHLLNDPTRGATLEAIVARMKLISLFTKNLDKSLRIIALSATIPNINELAEWLNAEKDCLSFGEEYRPVKIEKVVLGYNMAKNEFLFEKYLDYRLADLISKHSEGKPALVFCQTQKGTIGAAKQLCEDFHKLKFSFSEHIHKQLIEISEKVKDKQLGSVLRNSIAFHNASLSPEDRFLVEEYYKKGLIKVICTTSTLAQGVNLPARLVIIKSTYCYRGQNVGYTEYSKIEIDQMIGRAGRPQYDTMGIAIIMTEKNNVDKFKDLTNNSQDIQSHLMTSLIEHINSEISLSTIIDLETSLNWIKNTFMYIRMKNEKGKSNNINLDARLEKICKEMFENLKSIGLISYEENYKNIKSKPLGKKMCKNCVAFETMKVIVNINSNNEESIFEEISKALEFNKFRSKIEDRKILANLNKDIKIKYPIKGCIDTSAKKSYLLLQAALGNINIDQWELRREQNEILKYSLKIMNCLKAYFKEKDNALGYEKTLILMKNINQRLWNDSEMIPRQLPKIGEKLARQFVKVGLNTFEKIKNENPRKIESICGKNAPFGNILIDYIKSIPTLGLQYELVRNYKNYFKLQIKISTQFVKYVNTEESDPYSLFHLVVSRSNNGILLKAKIKPVINTKILNYFVNQISEEFFPINIRIICDKFVGLDQNFSITNNYNNDKDLKKQSNLDMIDYDLEKLIKDALIEHNSEKIDLTYSNNLVPSENSQVDDTNIKRATPKKLNRKEKKMKKEAEKCENIKEMIKNMKNLNTPINATTSLTNRKVSIDTDIQNTASTHFSLEKSLLKDKDNQEIPQINKKINFLKEMEKSDLKDNKPDTNKHDDDYKLIIDLNEFF